MSDSNEKSERERDILSSNHGIFRIEDRPKIMAQAEARLDRGEKWTEIVRDFHLGSPQYWGYRVVPYGHPATEKEKTEEQKRARNVAVFLWTALQSLVIIKGFIMYYGLNYAIEREDWYGGRDTNFYGWGLAVTLVISFGGLILFAIRKSRGQEWT